MSQIEQDFRGFLSSRPEISKCYTTGLINRRSLARYLVKERIVASNKIEATIAMLRRFDFKPFAFDKSIFNDIKVTIKDGIIIFEFEKEKEVLKRLQKLITHINYDKGDTLKIVVGTAAIKMFVDKEREKEVKELFKEFKLKNRFTDITEMSVMFSEKATNSKGILSTLSTELALNDIIINELLTGAPELLIYLKEEYVIKAYEIIKRLSK